MNIKKYTQDELKNHKKEYDINYIKNRYKTDDNFRAMLKQKANLYYIKKKYKKFIEMGGNPDKFFYKKVSYKF
jgi:hypothetical protein